MTTCVHDAVLIADSHRGGVIEGVFVDWSRPSNYLGWGDSRYTVRVRIR